MLINYNMQGPQDSSPDERYAVSPPKGVCKNKYCPEPVGRRDDLVRGYCPPCASIRVPPSNYRPARRQSGDDWNTISNLTLRV